MPEAYFWPDKTAVHYEGEANLLEVALDGEVSIAHLCGGRARCSTCRVRVIEGQDQLGPRTEAEEEMALRLDFPDEIRLACQTVAEGPVRVWRLVLDKMDVEMASQLGQGHYVGPVGREVPDAAVMFTDVAGFTSMSEALPAYDVIHILNRFFNRAGEAVEGNGGRIDNYMGDGLLAVFGIDGDTGAALSAVETALGVVDIANDMNDYVSRIYGHSFEIRVGIALGEVIFGLVGAEASARESVIGDVVNVASRIEAANKETGTRILVTDDVKARIPDGVEYGTSFELDLRGKAGMTTAHEVRGLLT